MESTINYKQVSQRIFKEWIIPIISALGIAFLMYMFPRNQWFQQ